jgi:hypothetical protein
VTRRQVSLESSRDAIGAFTGAAGLGITSIFMLTLRLCGPSLHDLTANVAAAFATKSFDNNFTVFLKLAWISHSQICRLANITPRILREDLLLYW